MAEAESMVFPATMGRRFRLADEAARLARGSQVPDDPQYPRRAAWDVWLCFQSYVSGLPARGTPCSISIRVDRPATAKIFDGTLNEWGGGDYRDLMAGVDEALHRYPGSIQIEWV